MEQAVSIERLHQQFSMPYETIAKRLGKAKSTVANIVRLLQLPQPAQEALMAGKLFEGHARAILALKDTPDKQETLLDYIVNRGWSIRQAEQYVVSVKAGFRDEKTAKQRVATETPETKALSKRFKAPVRIKRTAHGGRLEIGFKSDEELNRLTRLLGA